MQLLTFCTLAMVVTICTADVMKEKIKFFQGNVFRMVNLFNSSQETPNCSQQVMIYSPKVASSPRRLGACINSKYWAKDATGSLGILNNNTIKSFSLEHAVLNCSRINISGYDLLWRASLEVSAAATTTSLDWKFIFQLRCTNSNGSIFRKDVVYDIERMSQQVWRMPQPDRYKPESCNKPTEVEPNKTVLTQQPTTAGTAVKYTDLPLNSTFTAPQSSSIQPTHGDADHKNNLGMTIGFSVGIGVLLGVVFAWVCYRYRKRIRDKYTALFSRKNNNTVETAEGICSI